MAKSANASTITFGGSPQGELQSLAFNESAEQIQVTTLASSVHVFEDGILSQELTFDVLGVSSLSIGDTGAVAVAWNDGTNDTMTSGVVVNNERSGDLDGAITSSITIVPYQA